MDTSSNLNTDYTGIIEETYKDHNGLKQTRTYSRKRLIGRGGFARVYEVVDLQTDQVHACKIVSKSSLQKHRIKQKLMNEIKIHRSMRHSNIVNFHRVFEDSDNVYILLELCTNQTLHELIKRRKTLTEMEAKNILMQVISGLECVHSSRVIHLSLIHI